MEGFLKKAAFKREWWFTTLIKETQGMVVYSSGNRNKWAKVKILWRRMVENWMYQWLGGRIAQRR